MPRERRGCVRCALWLAAVLAGGCSGDGDGGGGGGPSTRWAIAAGNAEQDECGGVGLDADGDATVTGSFAGVMGNSKRMAVGQLTAKGKWRWALPGDVVGTKLAVDDRGNSFVAGNYTGAPSIGGSTLADAAAGTVFVAKIDGSGKLQWVATPAGSGETGLGDIAVDTWGHCRVTGGYSGDVRFAMSKLRTPGGAFVARLDGDGAWVWGRSILGNAAASGVGVDGSGNACVAGSFSGSIQFGTTALADGTMFLARIDDKGQWMWHSSASATAHDAAGVSHGGCVVGGSFAGSASFGTATLSASGTGAFVAAASKDGAWEWAAAPPQNVGLQVRAVVPGPNGGVLAAGDASSPAGIFVGHADQGGTAWEWIVRSGSASGSVAVRGVAAGPDGGIHVGGSFSQALTLGDETLTSNGLTDIFVWHLR